MFPLQKMLWRQGSTVSNFTGQTAIFWNSFFRRKATCERIVMEEAWKTVADLFLRLQLLLQMQLGRKKPESAYLLMGLQATCLIILKLMLLINIFRNSLINWIL